MASAHKIIVLPPYMFQMVDHIYISDNRGIIYSDHFDTIINTSNLFEPGILVTDTSIPNQMRYSIKKNGSNMTSAQNVTYLCNIMHQSTLLKKPMLLYSADYNTSASLFISYLTTVYHFSNVDIQRITFTKEFDSGLTNAIFTQLKKLPQ